MAVNQIRQGQREVNSKAGGAVIAPTTSELTIRSAVRHVRRRRQLVAAVDAVAWLIAVVVAVSLRFEFVMPGHQWLLALAVGGVAGILHVLIGYVSRLYRGRHRYGAFDEVLQLGVVALIVAVAISVALLFIGRGLDIPRATMALAFPFALVLMFGVRYGLRLVQDRARKPRESAEPTIIVGAGQVGDKLLNNMITDPASPFRPIGLLDDDVAKRNLILRGVPVVGRISELGATLEETGATLVIVAIAEADSALLRKINDEAASLGARVAVMPTLSAMMSEDVSAADIRDISIEDLIGRYPVDTNVDLIAGYITGKRVLVTGAGGSIGSELCRQLAKFAPAELIMLDRDETGLQSAQLGTAGHGLLDTKDVVLADIRDSEHLMHIFAERRPEVVFHAAALKHLPMLEQYPDEAWKTNVLGSLNVIEAARSVDVSTFINISTDKAANPTSVLGHSKRVAEKLTAWAAEVSGLRYLSVRFGNVIGSRGSMVPTFQTLIREGRPLTVTHPDATRFFMTVSEACQLVIQAGAIGRPGEVLILDMGEPVSILEVAQRMIAMSGKDIGIVFTGLRAGEKIHEELIGVKESVDRPFHPKVAHSRADPTRPDLLDKVVWEQRIEASRVSEESTQKPKGGKRK
jgi:FlaA1/EpsC-like NDP-sugar epimerase